MDHTGRSSGGASEEPAIAGPAELAQRQPVSISAELPPQVELAAASTENHLGDYILVRELARGGAGVVHLAWQCGLGRFVALKLHAKTSEVSAQRFVREAQVIAQISHPNIVPVYEAGEDRGRPYLVMQLIKGRTLSDLRLPMRRAIEVIRDAAAAIHHAHTHGIIHRDIKPQNMMLDQAGHLWVMDFGLARPVEAGATVTLQGHLVGTPEFMPPEQARGAPCDARSDVYALGATLYSLLVDQPPFVGKSAYDIIDQVLRADPLPLRHKQPDLPMEVEAIVAKAMARSPAARYDSADALADDLQNYLAGLPVSARPVTLLTRLGKWVRRHPTLAALLAMLTMSLSLLAAGAFVFAANMSRAHRSVEVQLARSLTAQGDALGLANRWNEARLRYDEARKLELQLGLPHTSTDLGFLDAEYHSPSPLWMAARHDLEVRALAVDRQSRLAISGGFEGAIKVSDLRNGDLVRILRASGPKVFALQLSVDDRHVFVADDSGYVSCLDVASGAVAWHTQAHRVTARALALSSDGRWLATGGRDGHVSILESQSGRVAQRWDAEMPEVRTLDFMPGADRIVVGGGSPDVSLREVSTGRPVRAFRSNGPFVMSLAVSPDGKTLAVGSFDHLLRLWDLETGASITDLHGHAFSVTKVFWLRKECLATGSLDGTMKVWDIPKKLNLRTITSAGPSINGAAMTADGRLAVTGDRDGRLQLLRVHGYVAPTLTTVPQLQALFVSESKNELVAQGPLDLLSIIDRHTGQILDDMSIEADADSFAAVGGNANRAMVIHKEKAVSLYDLENKRLVGRHQRNVRFRTPVFDPSRDAFWGWTEENRMLLFSFSPPGVEDMGPSPTTRVHFAGLSEDGKTLLVGGEKGDVALVDAKTLETRHMVRTHGGTVSAAALSRDGHRLIVGLSDPKLFVVDLRHPDGFRSLAGHGGQVLQVSMTPDASQALTSSSDGTAKLWDLETLQELHSFRVYRDGMEGGEVLSDATGFVARGRFEEEAGEDVLLFEFDTVLRGRHLEQLLVQAPAGAARRALLGRLFWDKGVPAWALDELRAAREGGATVAALELARAAWNAGDLEAAETYFREAIDANESDPGYLARCLRAVRRARSMRPGAPVSLP